jgi:hypothetical protein
MQSDTPALPHQEPVISWQVGAGAFAALTCLLLYLAPRHPVGALLLAGAVLGYGAFAHAGWRGKASARIAGFILLAVLLLLRQHAWDAELWSQGLSRYRSVVALLFGIVLLQRVFKSIDVGDAIRETLRRADPRLMGLIVMALATLLALPLSLATVAIVTAILSGVIAQPRDGACLSMRMVSLTTYLLPTTVASASVSASIPGLHLADVLLLGLPLFLLGTALNWRVRPQLAADAPVRTADTAQVKRFAVAFVVLFSLAMAGGAGVPEAVGICGLGLFIMDVVRRGQRPHAALLEVAESTRGCSAEVLLMFACGMLACTLERLGTEGSGLVDVVRTAWAWPGVAHAMVLFVLPVISIFGVHPLILFNLFFPMVDNALLGTPAAQYIAWVSMFVCAQLLSPVSISAVLAAGALGVSPADTSYKLHWKFAAVLAVAVLAGLLLTQGAPAAAPAPAAAWPVLPQPGVN